MVKGSAQLNVRVKWLGEEEAGLVDQFLLESL